MSVRLEFDGMAELRAALKAMPSELTHEASAIVVSHAEEAERLVESAYPQGPTGRLRRGVRTQRNLSRTIASAIVKSTAPHSHLFERGTGARRTRKGWNRGRMPVAPESQRMVPIAIRVRRRMVNQLIAMVERAGFTVSQS